MTDIENLKPILKPFALYGLTACCLYPLIQENGAFWQSMKAGQDGFPVFGGWLIAGLLEGIAIVVAVWRTDKDSMAQSLFKIAMLFCLFCLTVGGAVLFTHGTLKEKSEKMTDSERAIIESEKNAQSAASQAILSLRETESELNKQISEKESRISHIEKQLRAIPKDHPLTKEKLAASLIPIKKELDSLKFESKTIRDRKIVFTEKASESASEVVRKTTSISAHKSFSSMMTFNFFVQLLLRVVLQFSAWFLPSLARKKGYEKRNSMVFSNAIESGKHTKNEVSDNTQTTLRQHSDNTQTTDKKTDSYEIGLNNINVVQCCLSDNRYKINELSDVIKKNNNRQTTLRQQTDNRQTTDKKTDSYEIGINDTNVVCQTTDRQQTDNKNIELSIEHNALLTIIQNEKTICWRKILQHKQCRVIGAVRIERYISELEQFGYVEWKKPNHKKSEWTVTWKSVKLQN